MFAATLSSWPQFQCVSRPQVERLIPRTSRSANVRFTMVYEIQFGVIIIDCVKQQVSDGPRIESRVGIYALNASYNCHRQSVCIYNCYYYLLHAVKKFVMQFSLLRENNVIILSSSRLGSLKCFFESQFFINLIPRYFWFLQKFLHLLATLFFRTDIGLFRNVFRVRRGTKKLKKSFIGCMRNKWLFIISK